MCLIALAWQAHADFPLLVAANRDEWRDRPAEPAHWWPDHPGILAGRDLKAGGTWMGVTRGGRFSAITNFRDPAVRDSSAPSRGALVADFLLGDEAPTGYLSHLAPRAQAYNGFSLLVGDGRDLRYFASREDESRTIEPGVHGLSNHLLDEPWPKVKLAREAMQAALGIADPAPALFEMLSSRTEAPDAELPDTGVGLAWERRLASALIAGPDYGTRVSTVLSIRVDGRVRLEERTRDAEGAVTGTARLDFAIS